MKKKSTIIGQPLLDGLMMVGPRRTAISVRKKDGSVVVEELPKGRGGVFLWRLPFLRGIVHLFRQIYMATAGLLQSVELTEPVESPSSDEEEKTLPEAHQSAASETGDASGPETDSTEDFVLEAEKARVAAGEKSLDKRVPSALDAFLHKKTNLFSVCAVIAGVFFSVIVFVLLPRLTADFISTFIPKEMLDLTYVHLLFNTGEGLLRILIFFLYLALTAKVKEISDLWKYHGAANKVIACYEANSPLTVENIRKFSRFHPRSGTSFLFAVIIVSVFVFSVLGVFIAANSWWLDVLIRIVLIFAVTSVTYEIIYFAGKYEHIVFCRIFFIPGHIIQRFTTREPEDEMLEVALSATEAVIPEHEGEDVW